MVNWTFVNIFKTCLKRQTKAIGLKDNLLRLKDNLVRAPLVTIYKSFIRPLYGDFLYDQTFNNYFRERFANQFNIT